MLKKFIVLVLFILIAFTVSSQDSADRRRDRTDDTRSTRGAASQAGVNTETSTFTVSNNTGYIIRDIFVFRAGSNDRGDNMLTRPLRIGGDATIRMNATLDGAQLYTILLVDDGGDSYTKTNLRLTHRDSITVEMSDLVF